MSEIKPFDPNSIGMANGRYFGLPFEPDQAALVLLSIPWDVTTSYKPGASNAPDAIMDASLQCDLYDFHNPGGWKKGIGTLPMNENILLNTHRLRDDAERVINHLETGGMVGDDYTVRKLRRINDGSQELNQYVYSESTKCLDRGKMVGVVGGDHSVPLGLIKALSERYPDMGILHIDAHADLRNAYEGFVYSHASIMYNVLNESSVKKLVQVGVRDTCDEEVELAHTDSRIESFSDHALSEMKFEGENWATITSRIVNSLPHDVYISFDIDGLSPDNCPNTGTPVLGGLSFQESVYMINKVVESGRKIVGFDLCEVAPGEDNDWDANVGARVLYKLCNLALK